MHQLAHAQLVELNRVWSIGWKEVAYDLCMEKIYAQALVQEVGAHSHRSGVKLDGVKGDVSACWWCKDDVSIAVEAQRQGLSR